MKRSLFRHLLTGFILALVFVCLGLVGFLTLSNLGLPQHSRVTERLSELDKARLAEAIHLQQTLGDAAWPGWGSAQTPVILYNEEFAFITGYAQPPDGWYKMPAHELRGSAWEELPGDTFQGAPYYRQRLPSPDANPQAFTVMVGDQWVASMSTRDWMDISLRQQIRKDIPPLLAPLFPYRLFTEAGIRGSEGYMTAILHESFHAFQGIVAPQRLAQSEQANLRSEKNYPWDDQALHTAWQSELALLYQAVQAVNQGHSNTELATLARQFLTGRAERRQSARLSTELVDYERQREWLEGTAKYVQWEIWQQADIASRSDVYQPVSEILTDKDFHDYSGYAKGREQETDQIRRMSSDSGDGRFYYTGLAQCVLLDRLLPGWKERALGDGIYLEDLLKEASSF